MTVIGDPTLSRPDNEANASRASRVQPGVQMSVQPNLIPLLSSEAVETVIQRAESAASSAEALHIYRHWLSANGSKADAWAAWFNFALLRMANGEPGPALHATQAALQIRPDLWQAAVAGSQAAEAAGNRTAALAMLRRSLPPEDGRRRLHTELGRLLELEGRLGEAADELRASLLIDPAQPDVVQHLVHIRQRMAVWPVEALSVPGLSTEQAEIWCGPLAALALRDDPEWQARVNFEWIRRKIPVTARRLAPAEGYRHDRIRIGYLSSDFCQHAMSYLIAGLLELHDRSRFEVFGYCCSPEDGSDLRARVLAALDHHVLIGAMSDEAAAHRIREDEIDILIDLNGLTRGARLGVLAWKPAPVQATYLGYIGPVPLPELDWIITDAVAVPDEAGSRYRPAPLRVEGCYQANDSRQPELPSVTRAEERLPAQAFIFACASHFYKITPEVFEDWCRIMAEVPDSVLWLVEDTPEGRRSLEAAWSGAGLAPERLIFAPRTDPARYRARLALADLFLDTTPYNAGTITSDALRMGLPVLTMAGRAFAARMGASLLTAVGLTDCIASDRDDYVRRAIAFATSPGCGPQLRGASLREAWARTLGDTADFVRRFEDAIESVVLKG